MVDALKLEPLAVRWDVGVVFDPARHVVAERGATQNKVAVSSDNAFAGLSQLIREEVRAAGRPMPCGRLAQGIIDRQGAIAADWGGKGTFRRLLESLDLEPLRIDWSVAGGTISDPAFVLKGFHLGGHAFGAGADDAMSLAERFTESVLELCRREQLMLDDLQVAQLRRWGNPKIRLTLALHAAPVRSAEEQQASQFNTR